MSTTAPKNAPNPLSNLGVGCVKGLVKFALTALVVAGVLFYFLRQRYAQEPAGIAALALGGVFALFYGFFVEAFQLSRRAAALTAHGPATLTGGPSVVSGLVYPVGGQTLVSPPSGTECVAYWYEAKRPGSMMSFEGWALVPCEIRSVGGSFRLLGMPVDKALEPLGELPTRTLTGADPRAVANLRQYLETAPVHQFRLLVADFGQGLRDMTELLTDDDGSLRHDVAAPEADRSLAGQTIQERCLPVGAEVTVAGNYSTEKGGFVNPSDWTDAHKISLTLGGPAEAASKLRRQAVGKVIAGVVVMTVAAGIAYAVLEHGPR